MVIETPARAAAGDRRTPWRRSSTPRMALPVLVLGCKLVRRLRYSTKLGPKMCAGIHRPRLWRADGRFAIRARYGVGTARSREVPAFSMLLGDLNPREQVSVYQTQVGGMRGDISPNSA